MINRFDGEKNDCRDIGVRLLWPMKDRMHVPLMGENRVK
jgi:hypothetical protein